MTDEDADNGLAALEPVVDMKKSSRYYDAAEQNALSMGFVAVGSVSSIRRLWHAADIDGDAILNSREMQHLRVACNDSLDWLQSDANVSVFQEGLEKSEVAQAQVIMGANFLCSGFSPYADKVKDLSPDVSGLALTVKAFVDRAGGSSSSQGGSSSGGGGGGEGTSFDGTVVADAIVSLSKGASSVSQAATEQLENALKTGLESCPGLTLVLGQALCEASLIGGEGLSFASKLWNDSMDTVAGQLAESMNMDLAQLANNLKPAAEILAALSVATALGPVTCCAVLIPQLMNTILNGGNFKTDLSKTLETAMGEVSAALNTAQLETLQAVLASSEVVLQGCDAIVACGTQLKNQVEEMQKAMELMANGAATDVKNAYETIISVLNEAQANGAECKQATIIALENAARDGSVLAVAWWGEIRVALGVAASYVSRERLQEVAQAMDAASSDAMRLSLNEANAFSASALEASGAIMNGGRICTAQVAENALKVMNDLANTDAARHAHAAGQNLLNVVQQAEQIGRPIAAELKQEVEALARDGKPIANAAAKQLITAIGEAGLLATPAMAAARAAMRFAGDSAMSGAQEISNMVEKAVKSEDARKTAALAQRQGEAAMAAGMAAGALIGDMAVSGGNVALNIGEDIFSSEQFQNMGAVSFDAIEAGTKWAYAAGEGISEETLGLLTTVMGSICFCCSDFIKNGFNIGDVNWVMCDLVRDFFQLTGLFLSNLAGDFSDFGWNFWAKCYSFIAIDFTFTFPDLPPHVMYISLAVLCLMFLSMYAWVILTEDDSPNIYTEGHEILSWKDKASGSCSGWIEVNARIYILTGCMFLYLPVSRSALMIFTCHDEYEAALKGVSSEAECSSALGWWCTISAIFMCVVISLLLPFQVQQLIHKNKPRGSLANANITYDESGNEVQFTEAIYKQRVLEQMDPEHKNYSPYAMLYYGYERKWSYYKVLVMVFKTVVCLPVILLYNHPFLQGSITMVLLIIWGIVSYLSSPFIDHASDHLDYVTRISSFLTVLCATLAREYPGAVSEFGLVVNVWNILSVMVLIFIVVSSTHWYLIWLKNWRRVLSFTAYNPKTRFMESRLVSHENINERLSDETYLNPLVWDLRREKKVRIWHKFWDGFFAQLKQEYKEDPKHEVHTMATRHQFFKDQVADVGMKKIMRWYSSKNPRVLWARQRMICDLEGIDVWVGEECLMENDLIKIEGTDSDGKWSSRTGFAKVWLQMFPLRAFVSYDDDEDIAICYDPSILKIAEMNVENPEIKRRVKLRRKLRCLNQQMCNLPFQQYITKEVGDGVVYKDGKETKVKKTVSVLFNFKVGFVEIKQGKKPLWWSYNKRGCGCDPNKACKHKIDLSAGFEFEMTYRDGYGVTIEADGGEWHNEVMVKGPEHIGLGSSFDDTEKVTELFDLNKPLWEQGQLGNYSQLLMEYRNQMNDERTVQASLLSNSFWPNIYNNYDITTKEILPLLNENPTLNKYVQMAPEAWKYVWARMDFVSSHPSLLYWFVFWDDFWEENHEMKVMQDKIEDFGPNNPNSIMYRPIKRTELEAFLIEHELMSPPATCCDVFCGGRDLTLFFPKLLDKLYNNISSAAWTLHPEDDNFMEGQQEIYQARTLQLLRTNSGNLAGRGLDTTGDGTVDTFDFGDGNTVAIPPPPDANEAKIDNYSREQEELARTKAEIARVQAQQQRERADSILAADTAARLAQEEADAEMAARLREEERNKPPPPPPVLTEEEKMKEELRIQREHVKRVQAEQRQLKLDKEMAARLAAAEGSGPA